MNKIFTLLALLIMLGCSTSEKTATPEPVYPIPTEQQLAWHQLEQYAFIHFTLNTFTDKEWGYGDESPELMNPTAMDVDQWVRVIKEAGLKAVILTCKHHDGFTLWPSKFTEHSIAASPYKNGKGDIVKEVAEACKKYDLKFGVYLSPWDRNRADYGSPSYVEYYRNQLKELFENYGPIFEMWFDGANGGDGYYGGSNETRKIDGKNYYDWPTTIELVRGMEPNILFFSDAGPEIRWVGNEKGIAGETNWNNISTDTLYAGKAGITQLLNTGSENGEQWVPAEVDVSIRKGWFYHAHEDSLVKSPEQLFDIYLTSVGRGSNLLLNIPPDRRGLIHENDIAALQGWKQLLEERFGTNLALQASTTSNSEFHPSRTSANLVDGDVNTFWAAAEGSTSSEITIDLGTPTQINYVQLQEYIALGQRIKAFNVSVFIDGEWKEVAQGTTVGYKRILEIEPTVTQKVKIDIIDAKACAILSEVALF